MNKCLNCKHGIIQEIYDNQGDIFYFVLRCNLGVSVCDIGNVKCDKFEKGKRKFIRLTDDEKYKHRVCRYNCFII